MILNHIGIEYPITLAISVRSIDLGISWKYYQRRASAGFNTWHGFVKRGSCDVVLIDFSYVIL